MNDQKSAEEWHRPVLCEEACGHLTAAPVGALLDCTFGMGGHASVLLAAGRTVEGVDRDASARALARQRLGQDFPIVPMSYGEAVAQFVDEGRQFAGLLADLGVSSLQLDDAARGFSIRSPVPLDLRMDTSRGESALELIDRLSAEELADVDL